LRTKRKHISEKLLERKLIRGVKKKGGRIIKLTIVFETGWPDRLILMLGARSYFAELKTTGEDLSPRQKLVRAQLEALGFKVYKIDDEESLEKCLDEI